MKDNSQTKDKSIFKNIKTVEEFEKAMKDDNFRKAYLKLVEESDTNNQNKKI